MPSACIKVEKVDNNMSVETSDPLKQVLNLIDKKIRNLEKRKVRLDAVKEKKQHGEELNSEQKEALDKYELVLQSIEFIKELQKSVQQLFAENEKLAKKQQKKEKSERIALEQRRFRELLALQGLLTGLGEEKVRNDFLHGTNGAVLLTKEELDQLDELYKLISPPREDNNNFALQLSQAAEHIVCLLDGKDKPVMQTTYHTLRQIVQKVENCSYFERPASVAVVVTAETDEKTEPAAPVTEISNTTSVAKATNVSESVELVNVSLYNGNQATSYTTNAYYSAPQTTFSNERPLQEIVTSGPFDFIQESQIDATHEDNMPYLPQSMYNSTVLVSQPQPIFADPSQLDKSYLPTTVFVPTALGVTSASAVLVPTALTTAQYQAVAAAGGLFTLPHISQPGIMSSQVPLSSTIQPIAAETLEAYSVPVGYPNQSSSNEEQDKKPFTMNPDADEFQSMYSTAGLTFTTESQTFVNSNLSAAIDGGNTEEGLEHTEDDQEWVAAGYSHQRNGGGPGYRGARNDRGRGFGRGSRRGFGNRGFHNGRGGRGGGYQGGYNQRYDWKSNSDYDNKPNGPPRGGRGGRGFFRGGRDNKDAVAETQ